jgi:UDP-N-acetylmuramoyl-tripeptide--D-alanyl-D-alanine ligase
MSVAGAGEKKVVCNSGNLNSETGLPLSVFGVRAEHEIGIFEAGMNRVGEIGELAHVLKPQIALITNVGSAHIGLIGSKKGIAIEKKAIFGEFTGVETALIPENDEFAAFLGENVNGKTCFFGEKSEKLKAKLVSVKDLGLFGWEIDWAGEAARFALPGRHNLDNALAACAIAGELGLSDESVRQGLESVKPLFGRGEILVFGGDENGRSGISVVRDCYNANPESMDSAIEFCDCLSWSGQRVYVVGSMLELGEASVGCHRKLGEKLAASGADVIFLFGEEAAVSYEAAISLQLVNNGKKSIFHTNDIEELKEAVKKTVKSGSLVLLKGSRGCALERVCEVFEY